METNKDSSKSNREERRKSKEDKKRKKERGKEEKGNKKRKVSLERGNISTEEIEKPSEISGGKKNVVMFKPPTTDRMAQEPTKMNKGVVNVGMEVEGKDASAEAIVLKLNAKATEEFGSDSHIIDAGHKAVVPKNPVARTNKEPDKMNKGNPNLDIEIEAKDKSKDITVSNPTKKTIAELGRAIRVAEMKRKLQMMAPPGYPGYPSFQAIVDGSLKVTDNSKETNLSKVLGKFAPGSQNINDLERLEAARPNTGMLTTTSDDSEALNVSKPTGKIAVNFRDDVGISKMGQDVETANPMDDTKSDTITEINHDQASIPVFEIDMEDENEFDMEDEDNKNDEEESERCTSAASYSSDASSRSSTSSKREGNKDDTNETRRVVTRDAVKSVQGYYELNESEDDPDDNQKPVVVYSNVLEGILSDDDYKCLEDSGNCVIIFHAVKFLKKEVAIRNVFHKMKGSCWSEEALVCFEKSQDDGLFDNIKQKYPSLEIDRRALLLMTTPIRFARIKVIDIKAVSSKYDINEYFRRAIRESGSVTSDEFPCLYANKDGKPSKRGTPNITKLLKTSQRKIMFFVVRLHYANHIFHIMQNDGSEPFSFNFNNFPELKLVLTELEMDLANMISVKKIKLEGAINKNPEAKEKGRDEIISTIRGKITAVYKAMKVMMGAINDNMKRISMKLDELENVEDKTEIENLIEAKMKEFGLTKTK